MTMTKKEQNELKVAQMRAEEYQAKIDALFGDAPTNTFYSDILNSQLKDYPLTPGANIKFKVGKYGQSIQARIRNGTLEIKGDSDVLISPLAANCFEIRIRER